MLVKHESERVCNLVNLLSVMVWIICFFTLQDYAKTDGLEYVCPHCSITTYKKKPHRVANGSPQGIMNPRIPWFSFGLPISRFWLHCFSFSFFAYSYPTREIIRSHRLVDEFCLRWCAAKPLGEGLKDENFEVEKRSKETRAHKEDFIIGSFLTSL